MSATNRPTSRWSSSTKSTSSINQPTSSLITQKKPCRSLINQQYAFSQRMAKTRHDVEQLFKLYYTTNIKFDTFQKQIITGTRIPSAPSPGLYSNHLFGSSSNVFQSKHCVSREDEEHPSDINEQQEQEQEEEEIRQIPIKRTVQVRIDNNPTIVHSTSPSPEGIRMPSHIHSITIENPSLSTQQNEYSTSSIMKSISYIDDISTDFHDNNNNNFKKSKSITGQHSLSSITTLPPISSTTLSLINNRKDLINLSHSSFSTINSLQQSNLPHIVTGTAVIVRKRSPTKSASLKQRAKSSTQQTNLKTSAVTIQYDQPEFPTCLGARVVSIPSKCSRYVLLTFPQSSVRYQSPSYVERILLPERFPTLFQNIVHNRNNK